MILEKIGLKVNLRAEILSAKFTRKLLDFSRNALMTPLNEHSETYKKKARGVKRIQQNQKN